MLEIEGLPTFRRFGAAASIQSCVCSGRKHRFHALCCRR